MIILSCSFNTYENVSAEKNVSYISVIRTIIGPKGAFPSSAEDFATAVENIKNYEGNNITKNNKFEVLLDLNRTLAYWSRTQKSYCDIERHTMEILKEMISSNDWMAFLGISQEEYASIAKELGTNNYKDIIAIELLNKAIKISREDFYPGKINAINALSELIVTTCNTCSEGIMILYKDSIMKCLHNAKKAVRAECENRR